MKELDYSRKSWHSKLYQSTYNSLPTTICGYFWKLIFAIIIAPVAIIGHIINIICKNYVVYAGLFSFIPIISYTIGMINQFKGFWYILGGGFLYLLLYIFSGVVTLLFCAGCSFLRNKYIENRDMKRCVEYKEKTPNPLIEGFKSWKNKYCSKINWIN